VRPAASLLLKEDAMDIGKITQLAKDEFGPQAKSIYHQNRTGPRGHLKTDDIGAGDFIFVDSCIPGSNPQHAQTPDGLVTSVERAAPSGNTGSWGAANLQNIQLPGVFLLVAVMERPARVPLNAQFVAGVYAPSLLMNVGTTLMGVTSQFRPEGVRLNLPGTMLNLNALQSPNNFKTGSSIRNIHPPSVLRSRLTGQSRPSQERHGCSSEMTKGIR
jgi:hypothetical protein